MVLRPMPNDPTKKGDYNRELRLRSGMQGAAEILVYGTAVIVE
jgi:hypothetical protein